jgi:hypothetical protein
MISGIAGTLWLPDICLFRRPRRSGLTVVPTTTTGRFGSGARRHSLSTLDDLGITVGHFNSNHWSALIVTTITSN